jgi:hypothetical protein
MSENERRNSFPQGHPVIAWRTSSYSANGRGDCVEVGWKTSSYSLNTDGRCVEAARPLADPARVAVRDSQHRGHGFLVFGAAEWQAFLHATTRGEL